MIDPNLTTTAPYLQGIDDLGDNPLGADNARVADSTDTPLDPISSEANYRRAVLTLLTEIRDLLLADAE